MQTPEVNEPAQENTALIKAGEILPQKPGPMVLQLGRSEEQASGAFSFSILWQAFLQRFRLAFPLGLVLAAIACGTLKYFTEDKYRSAALLQIHEKQPFVAYETGHSIGSPQTRIELLRGSFIIGRAIEMAGLMQLPELQEISGKEDAVLWIQKRLKAERIGPPTSELYEVSFTTRIRETAQKVAAAVVDSYMQFQLDESQAQQQIMLQLLADEQKLRDAEINLKRENLRELARQAGGEDAMVMDVQGGKGVSARAIGRVALMSKLQGNLVDTEVEIEVAKARIGALREELNKNIRVPESQIETAVNADPAILKLKHEIQAKRDSIKVLSDHNNRIAGEKVIEKIEADLEEKTRELRPKIQQEQQDQVTAQRRDALNTAETQLANDEKMAVLFREKIVAERNEQAERSDKSLEVEFARDELTRAEEVRRRVADRAIALTIEGRAPGAVASIQPAKLPGFPDGPTLAKKLAMAGGAAFFAPFLLLIGWDMLHRRVLEREQLAREFDLKIVSEVAALPARAMLPRPGADRAYQLQAHLFEESVNSLRTTLAVDENLQGCRVFVVASAVSGEGKTNLSSQLAMSWSHAVEGRIIIVDADLRAPNIHDLFEIKSGPGLAEVLRGECTLDDAVVMDWGDRLFVLPAGAAGSSSPSHLFSGPRFRDVIARLRSTYDRIIVDVPPILCASETLLIAKEADGVLMCALHDYSRSGQVKQAYERLTGAGVKVVGAVLNGAPARKYAYSYRGYVPS